MPNYGDLLQRIAPFSPITPSLPKLQAQTLNRAPDTQPMMPQPKAPLLDPADPSSYRRGDPTQIKGIGFLGPLTGTDGKMMTEYSIGVNINGKEIEIPSFVPTLTKEELEHLLGGGQPTDAIIQKAVEHAKMRMSQGLPVFAGENDKPVQLK